MARKFPIIKDIYRLYDAIEVTSAIVCSKCGVKEILALDAEEAAEFFAINGRWRGTPNNIYCPSCAKKYLK